MTKAPNCVYTERTMEVSEFLSGQLLLAMPGIGDPRFARAVIALCAHGPDGALGIGIGRLAPRVGFHDLLNGFEIDAGVAPNCPVHVGGPVEPRRGFVLHSADWAGEDTITVGDRWALTGTTDILRAIAAGEGPGRWLVALGYAGWAPGQLEEEMTRHGWFNTAADDRLLFDVPVDRRWPAAFRAAGVDSAMLVSEAGTA